MQEHVVLVDEQNNVLGTAPKLETHNNNTPLHRGFSVFLFNKKGGLLLQQRALHKKTWPGVWSNSCCGHPSLNESVGAAAHRRLSRELGLTGISLEIILPNYRYTCEKDSIVENEVCPVLVGFTENIPALNQDEVANIRYISWEKFLNELRTNQNYSPWCMEESLLLEDNKIFQKLYQENTLNMV